MFGRHEATTKQQPEVLVAHQDSDPAMRDEVDPDPLIEEMVERLRSGLGSLVAFDEWGRPVAWRQVVRIAAGPTLAALRDAQTAVALGRATQQAEPTAAPEPTLAAEPTNELAPEATLEPDAESTTTIDLTVMPEPAPAPALTVMPEPTPAAPERVAESAPEPTASEEPAPPKPAWSYQPTATGWVSAPTTFGLRQIDLEAGLRPDYTSSTERYEV